MRCVLRRGLQRLYDHLLNLGVTDRPRFPRAWLINQPIKTISSKPRSPLPYRLLIEGKPLRDLRVLQSLSRRQHDPRALRQRLSTLRTSRPRLQLLTLFIAQNNFNRYRTWHPPNLKPTPDELTTHDTRHRSSAFWYAS